MTDAGHYYHIATIRLLLVVVSLLNFALGVTFGAIVW
jgi:hypothetical protein